MTGRIIGPVVIGILGVAMLVALGIWQLQRLAWKEDVLAEIETRITAAPVQVPAAPDPERDRFLPVSAVGEIGAAQIRVLVSRQGAGAGYRIISPLQLAGRAILLDRGFLPVAAEQARVPEGARQITGNLHWPDEIDGFTPEPDLAANIWYARDVPALAEALGTEPILLIARDVEGEDPRLSPMPVSTEGIPNNHLGYAIQWFGLAIVWLGMTLFLLWRITRRSA